LWHGSNKIIKSCNPSPIDNHRGIQIMYTLPNNKNLTIFNQSHFNGWEVIPGYEMVTQYLGQIQSVLKNALVSHPRTLVIRFDLHLPSRPDCVDDPFDYDSTVITRFIESFKAQLKADLAKKNREGKRVHPCSVRYLWAKEKDTAPQSHYHVALLLNKDAYYALGNYNKHGDNLANKIYKAWGGALWLDSNEVRGLVHFPSDTPFYHLDTGSLNFGEQYESVFRRLSYLAKAKTKQYGSGGKNFGCSQR
jgi:hypothetical protein